MLQNRRPQRKRGFGVGKTGFTQLGRTPGTVHLNFRVGVRVHPEPEHLVPLLGLPSFRKDRLERGRDRDHRDPPFRQAAEGRHDLALGSQREGLQIQLGRLRGLIEVLGVQTRTASE